MMGGIVTDLDARSTLDGLYAVGECSCTGLHGANRLASNSLSECFVFAGRAVAHALSRSPGAAGGPSTVAADALRSTSAPPSADAETRAALWRDAGIVRSQEGLSRLLDHQHPLVRLIAGCGLAREESRGAHLRQDHPERDPALDHRHAVVSGEQSLGWEHWQ
jgi:L-aspartate oxidase